MCVPLVDSAGRTIGVLELVDKASGGSFTEDDARLLHLFARQAAVALRNSLRVDRLRAVRHAEGALLATVRALCIPARHPTATSAGTPTLKARQGLLTVGEAAQRCLGVEHVRVLVTAVGSRELSVAYSSHPDHRAVPLASAGALAASARGKGQTWHKSTGVTRSHGVGVSPEVQRSPNPNPNPNPKPSPNPNPNPIPNPYNPNQVGGRRRGVTLGLAAGAARVASARGLG